MFYYYPLFSGFFLLFINLVNDPKIDTYKFLDHNNTIKESIKIFNKYDLYIPIMFLFLMKCCPTINDALEYYYGYYLSFGN